MSEMSDSTAVPVEPDEVGAQGGGGEPDPVIAKLALLTRVLGQPVSPKALMAQTLRQPNGRVDLNSLAEVLSSHGFQNQLVRRSLQELPAQATPLLVLLAKGEARVVMEISGEGESREFTMVNEDGTMEVLSAHALQKKYLGFAWLVKMRPQQDRRSELPEYTLEKAWFWKVIWRFKGYYAQVVFATVLVNVLALIGSLYVMNVYDRVIPNRAYETLWVLTIGVLLANVFEFVGRLLRARLTDIAGKKADLIISAALFRRVLSIDLAHRPASSGSYANNLRDFEAIREFMTSASLLALVDLPFILLFVLVMHAIGGSLAIVPLLTIPVVIIVGLLVQKPLAKYANESMKEGAQRQGLAVEAIEGIDTLKANNAGNWAQSRWERYTAATAMSSMKQKDLSNFVIYFSTLVQQANTAFLVCYGTYLIHSDNVAERITMGALIATVILSGRALAPLSAVAGLMIRWQQARMAMQGLNSIVDRPTERDPNRSYLTLNRVQGGLRFANVSFQYGKEGPSVIRELNCEIRPGEKVGILGRIGSGKSTFLWLASGMYQPQAGNVLLDNVDMRQIDPADVRSHVSLLSQNPRLFLGTLRENLEMGRMDRLSNDDDLIAALARFGLDGVIRSHPRGLDMPLGENGHGLSGGQRQLVGLARLTLRDPRVVLLDEPTSGLDQMTELQALRAIRQWADQRTLVVVTHRPQVLLAVDRVIVIEHGRIVMDGPRDAVLKRLSQPPQPQQRPQPQVQIQQRPADPALKDARPQQPPQGGA